MRLDVVSENITDYRQLYMVKSFNIIIQLFNIYRLYDWNYRTAYHVIVAISLRLVRLH